MNISTFNIGSDANPATTLGVMSIFQNTLGMLSQLKNPYTSIDASFNYRMDIVEQALQNSTNGTFIIQERAYVQATQVDSLDFGYTGAPNPTPTLTKLGVAPNMFKIADVKFYDKFLTQTMQSGIELNPNRYITGVILAQMETLSADYAAKLTRYMDQQAVSACKCISALIDYGKKLAIPFGSLYTPPSDILRTYTDKLNIGSIGGILEQMSRMIAPASLDPERGTSGFVAMNSMVYSGLARDPSGFISVTNERILREVSTKFSDEYLQMPTGQYISLSRIPLGDRTAYFQDANYAIPRIDGTGAVVSGIATGWEYTWIDYNIATKKWQIVIKAPSGTGKKLAFGDMFYDYSFNGLFYLESHASEQRFPLYWVIDKPDNFVSSDVSTHWYPYLTAAESPYGVEGWVVNVTLNVNNKSFWLADPAQPTGTKYLAKSFSKFNVYFGDLIFDTQAEAESLPTSKVKLDALKKLLFTTTDPTSAVSSTVLFPVCNNRESIVMWNPVTRYEIPFPVSFTYQGTGIEPIMRGDALSRSNMPLRNMLGSSPFMFTMGPWAEEGAYHARAGLTHTSAWLSHNFNVAIAVIDKSFIHNEGWYNSTTPIPPIPPIPPITPRRLVKTGTTD